jgi:hypothetical protein
MIAAVDAGKLFELAWASLVVGVALVTLFAVLILSVTRATDLRRSGRAAASGALYGVAFAAGAACLIAIGLGLTVIVSK